MTSLATAGALRRVRNAAQDKSRSEAEYRAALAAAYRAGVSYAELARAAGVSRQNVRQILTR